MVVVRSLVFALALLGACNSITGTSKYEVVDCPSGSCGDSGTTPNPIPLPPGTEAGVDADTATDAGACAAGEVRVHLTVTGSGDVQDKDNQGRLTVGAGSTNSNCYGIGSQVRFETSGGTATWTSTPSGLCPSQTDRCQFNVPSVETYVVAAL
jgi:hypothetical protein